MKHKMLIAIPTYNECENVEKMCSQILALGLETDVLFVDDNSPDGTGQILDRLASENPTVQVMHRPGKQGIGTAHLAAIRYAYDNHYETLVTMDCDFTHSPSDIPRLLELHAGHDVTVGSRYLAKDSLPGWNVLRRSLTALGHFLTRSLLGMDYDATGAFRVYRLTKIPVRLFDLIRSRGYSFFFESLFIAHLNGFSIGELAIVLPARTYGHSKMSLKEAARSARQVLSLSLANHANRAQFQLLDRPIDLDAALNDPQNWNAYWEKKSQPRNFVYDFIASIYRDLVLRRQLNKIILRTFPRGSRLLHAGCGGGQVDHDLHKFMQVTALDISQAALEQYGKNNPGASALRHCDILNLRLPEASFDGVYNLGVVEHFTEQEILRILSECRRVLVPGGKIVIFWPHIHAPSVYVLGFAHWWFNNILDRNVRFHPAEISLLRSKQQVQDLMDRSKLTLTHYKLGLEDGYIQAVIVAQKPLA